MDAKTAQVISEVEQLTAMFRDLVKDLTDDDVFVMSRAALACIECRSILPLHGLSPALQATFVGCALQKFVELMTDRALQTA
jgi:F420-0:gamma-glutamyl ligase